MVSLPNYQIQRVIGSGCFESGYVFQAVDHTHNRRVALKRIEKVGNQLSRQYEILFQLKDCQNVVHILDFFYSRTEQNKLIQNIVFEYVEDNLQNLLERTIKNKKSIDEQLAKPQKYIYQILNGLSQIHAKGIAHRDLKPQNVLLSDKGQIKICDFGSSKQIDPQGKNTPYIVSRYYRAPELILCVTKYGTAIDIWATGCILAQMFTLGPIFKGKTQGDQLFAIFKVLGSLSAQEVSQYTKRVPFDAKLFSQFGNYERINLRQRFRMVKDYENFEDLLLKMLNYLPERRISAEQALKHPFFDDVRGCFRQSSI